jgi:hypothetical protein
MCDGKPFARRHLVSLLFDLYFVHGRLQWDSVCSASREYAVGIEPQS